MKQVTAREALLSALLFAIIMLPSFRAFGYDLRLEEPIALAVLAGALAWLAKYGELRVHRSAFAPVLVGFGVLILFSIMAGVFRGLNPSGRDLMELVKLVKYLLIFLIVATLANTPERREKLVRQAVFLISLTALVAVAQYYNFLGLNEYYVHYIAPTQAFTLVGGYPYPRAVGFTSNPNLYAIMASIGVLLAAAMFFKRFQGRYIAAAALCLTGLLLTQSRSGLAFLGVSLLCLVALHLLQLPGMEPRQARLVVLWCLLGAVILVLFLQFAPASITWRFKEGLHLATDATWLMRLERWESTLELIGRGPLFGWGPAKSLEIRWVSDLSDYEWFVDNEWLFLTSRYGLIGTLYFVLAMVGPALLVPRREEAYFYRRIYFALLPGAAVYMIAGNIYHSLHIMPLVIVLTGLYFASGHRGRLRFTVQRPGTQRHGA